MRVLASCVYSSSTRIRVLAYCSLIHACRCADAKFWASVAMANNAPSGDQLADAIRAIKERSPDFGIKRVHAELKQSRGW